MSKARTLNPYDMEERIHNLEENGGGTTDGAKRADIATEFSAETSYTAGNYVYYEGTLYIFNVDHAAGEWDATDVSVANVTDEVTSNKAAIDSLDTRVTALEGGGGSVIATAVSTGAETYSALLDTLYSHLGTNQSLEVDGLIFRQVGAGQFSALSEDSSSTPVVSVITVKATDSVYDFWNNFGVRNAKGSYGTTAGLTIKLIQN